MLFSQHVQTPSDIEYVSLLICVDTARRNQNTPVHGFRTVPGCFCVSIGFPDCCSRRIPEVRPEAQSIMSSSVSYSTPSVISRSSSYAASSVSAGVYDSVITVTVFSVSSSAG